MADSSDVSEAERHQAAIEELRNVSRRWAALKEAWPKLLAAEAEFQYDTLQREHLQEEDSAVPRDAKQCVLALLDACYHAIVEALPQGWDDTTAGAAAEAATRLVESSLAAVDEAEAEILDHQAIANGIRAVGQHLSALVSSCPAAAAAADVLYAAAATRMQAVQHMEGVDLQWQDIVDVHQARAMAAAASPDLLTGSFQIALTSYQACLELEQEHANGGAVQQRLMEMASTCASHGVFGLAAHYLRELLQQQTTAACAPQTLLSTMRGALRAQLQLAAFLSDPMAACSGDKDVVGDIQGLMALPLCVTKIGHQH